MPELPQFRISERGRIGQRIPWPDAVFYGRILFDCRPVTAQDNVKVIATVTVGGEEKTVGTYKMGASAPLGDHCAPRIRRESGDEWIPGVA